MTEFKITNLLKPYRGLLFYSAITNILFSSLALTLPWMLGIAIDKVFPTSDYTTFFILSGAMVVIYMVRSIFRYMAGYLGTYTVMRILVDVRQRIFRHLQSLSLRFYEEYRTGKLVSNVISDVSLLQQLVGTIIAMADQIFSACLITILLLAINLKLGLIVLAIAPLHFLNFVYFRKILQRDALTLQEKMSEITANLSETINGIKVVKSFGKERTECRDFFSTMRPTIDLGVRLNLVSNFCWSICDILSVLTYLTVIGFGISFVQYKEMSIGEFVAFYSYVGGLLGPVSAFATYASTISQGLAGTQRIVKLLKVIPEIRDVPRPIKAGRLKGDIVFDDVSFSYVDTPVIKHLNLKIAPGQKVALVGPSGCGKSTISNLLLRFYDVSSGRLTIDGVDIRKYAMDSYRNNVGVVLQEPFLFSGSIRDNISYAHREATKEEVEHAARMANVEEFVNNLERGYETVIGENGASLSGGQKQRIAIARAILKNPAILILDEATSALDTVSEYLVQKALDNLMADRTTIIIAHRLSTIKNADTIVVLRAGEVKQMGAHDDLMEQEGIYREMYTTQQKTMTQPEA